MARFYSTESTEDPALFQKMQHLKDAARIRSARSLYTKPRRISLPAPIATISFDDFARSAWTVGGEIVESFGGRATYYVSGGFCGRNTNGIEYFSKADLAEILARGHEIASHSFDHIALPSLSQSAILSDLERNAAFIRDATGQEDISSSLAYPYGAASIRTKWLLRNHFQACRGIEPGINADYRDFSQLRAVCLQPIFLKRFPIARLIKEVCARNGWLIFIGHDVSQEPTQYGGTPKVLREAVAALNDAGIELVTMREALKRVGQGV
jgi:peptidoglycan/xylan/chitin deacetylase (PgdA/CDA1 family)